MIHLTKEEFNALLPEAVDPDGRLYEKTSEYIHKAELEVRKLIGPELDDTVGSLPDIALHEIKSLVASRALYEALPHLDLVLTPTGFGVVSNQQVAPASAERVDRLRSALLTQVYDATDRLLDSLRGNEKWCNTPGARSYFRFVIWRGSQMTAFGIEQPTRGDMVKRRPIIHSASMRLAGKVSHAQLAEWCAGIRCRSLSDNALAAVDMAVEAIAAYAGSDRYAFSRAAADLVDFMEAHIDDFPAYKSSSAYSARHASRYENKADDPCYFFGG